MEGTKFLKNGKGFNLQKLQLNFPRRDRPFFVFRLVYNYLNITFRPQTFNSFRPFYKAILFGIKIFFKAKVVCLNFTFDPKEIKVEYLSVRVNILINNRIGWA